MPGRDLQLIAHRGFAGVAPENTVAAATFAAAHGADAIECDVAATADGTPVVFHDAHLGAAGRDLTDREGRVATASTAHVTGATVLESGEQVPTLAAFAAAVPDGVTLNVELKRPGESAVVTGPLTDDRAADRRDVWQPFVDRVFETLPAPTAVLFSSFAQGALAAVRTRCDATVAPLARTLADARQMADRLDATTIHPALDTLAPGEAAGCEYTVNAWTARTWRDVRTARRAGVDGIIGDYPSLGAYEAQE